MTEAKQGNQTKMKTHTHTHTHTHCPSTSKTFSHKAPGQPEGQLVVGMDQRSPPPVDAPSCSIHSPPYTPRGPLCLLTTSREEVAEQCGGSENGHRAQDPGPVLGGPGLPPWLPFSTSHPPPQLVSLKAGLPQTSLPILVELQIADDSLRPSSLLRRGGRWCPCSHWGIIPSMRG